MYSDVVRNKIEILYKYSHYIVGNFKTKLHFPKYGLLL